MLGNMLTACALLLLGHGEATGYPTLHWWDKGDGHATPMGYFFINFALLLWGLWRFALPKLRSYCQQQADSVRQTMATNQQAYVEATARLAQLEQALQQEPGKQASRLVHGQTEWEQQTQQALAQAQTFAARLKRDAEQLLVEEQRLQTQQLVRRLGLQVIANVQQQLPKLLEVSQQAQFWQESIRQVAAAKHQKE